MDMWQPGEGVLYTWVEWIRSAEFLRELDLFQVDDTDGDIIRYASSSIEFSILLCY